jgi:hypothetical protein
MIPRLPNLDPAELSLLLYLDHTQGGITQMGNPLAQPIAVGLVNRYSESPAIAITDLRRDMADLMARRLLADNREMPVLSANDLVNLVRQLLDRVVGSVPIGSADRLELERQLVEISQFVSDAMQLSQSIPQQYDKLWGGIVEVCSVAAEEAMTPRDLLESQDGRDTLMRHRLSAEEFVDQARQVLASFDECAADNAADMPEEAQEFRRMIHTDLTDTAFRVWAIVPEL